MKRNLILVAVAVAVAACKSAQPAAAVEKPVAEETSASKIITGHYANLKDFKTLSIKASAKYKDDNQSQSITADIRVRKDETIFISIRFLGITMAKALITPTEVKYYEKLNSTYFEGDYAKLSQWLGTELDFKKVQNLLIGQALDDLRKGKYAESVENNLQKLEETTDRTTKKIFYFEPETFFVNKEEVSQPSQRRSLEVNYPGYTKHATMSLPSKILLEAVQPKGKTNISIEYNSVSFNEEISFPYSVPEGYERVEIE
ncbi:MAG: DUF4292 domain-containing protein [Flavobacterium sp.]|uniref:DUF4292 domain-containing protein n=1 Tax=Flavobacterium sp. TaxID=239 RepID=UPI00121F6E37|nr:DUF4292 domain-containing protein [Flavobacterium sp.]RZJ67872.1 MAG: DUF4292 domain-containing protein [Flavobacterium sp.]